MIAMIDDDTQRSDETIKVLLQAKPNLDMQDDVFIIANFH